MKIPLVNPIPVLSRGVATTVAIAAGVLAPSAMSASGDLDPNFGDVGRIGPIVGLNGPAWSMEIQDDEGIVFAGGDVDLVCRPNRFCDLFSPSSFELTAAGFIDRLTASGLPDSSFNAPDLVDIQVLDIALQSDDKIIAVGSYIPPNGHDPRHESRLIVFRLQRSGSLDPTFGGGSLVNLPLPADTHGTSQFGGSVLVDSNGRIVIAGIRSNHQLSEQIVLRLLSDGSFDETFGNAGVFIGPAIGTGFFSDAMSILQTATGGYRLMGSEPCQILALTEGGTVDDSFGNAGIASVVNAIGDRVNCNGMVAQADGLLVMVGRADGHGFVTRLLANGESDPGFAAGDVLDVLADATALAVDSDGSIAIGGLTSDFSDVVVIRLQPNGALNQSFGNAGTTVIDLPTDTSSLPVIREVVTDRENRVVAAGGDYTSFPEPSFPVDVFDAPQPFLFRLFGDSDSASAGVIGVVQADLEAAEPDQVVVRVRRTGGKTGNVSVAYATVSGDETLATGGEDYGEIADRLTWDDGDTSEREIVVQIFDNDGVVEEAEQFRIALSDAQGGAGLGTRNATVSIRPDGEPNGQFSIQIVEPSVSESDVARVWVQRNYYYDGAVSVTLTPVAGTATADDDFIADPVTLSWADDDDFAQIVEIALNDDAMQEGSESFTVELTNPTGGAVIGPRSSGTITIEANDAPPPPPPPRGGGGATGPLSLLLLGLAAILSSLRRSAGNRR
jgi:uncharacterized delta-60 repeat protein